MQTEAGFAIGEKSVPYFDFVLGGYGYNFLSLAGDSYIKSTVTVDYEFLKKNHINLSANYANIEDNLFESTKWISAPQYSGYALGYGLETIIGPIELKYTWSPETGKGLVWFNIGFWF